MRRESKRKREVKSGKRRERGREIGRGRGKEEGVEGRKIKSRMEKR